MKRLFGMMIICCWAAFTSSVFADCPHCNNTGACYKEVICYRCVRVPDVKPIKKVFYECRKVPYCLPALPGFLCHDCDDCCADCEHPRFKHVLVKREVEVGQICGTKCVIEEYVEHVQVPCCHCDCHQGGVDPACDVPAQAVERPPVAPEYQY